MPKKQKKLVRCPYLNRNLWISLEIEKTAEGEEILVSMTCLKRDAMSRNGEDCGVACKNYFFGE